MRNCFIPGCDRLCRHEGKTKRAMFFPPKDKELFEEWLKVLPKQRPFKAHDKVCERHFHEHEICRNFENSINGLLYKMERGRVRLYPKSIPSLNLDCALSNTRKRTVSSNVQIKESTILEQPKIIIHSIENLEEQHLEVDGEVQQAIVSTEEFETIKQNSEEIPTDPETFKINDVQVCETQIQELFNSIFDDIYEVVLPNTLWGLHRCPERSSIFFSFIDPGLLRTTKLVSISSQGEIRVLVGNRLISEQSLVTDVNSIDSLTQMINEVDEIRLCLKMFENDHCEVSLKDASSEICDACEQSEIQ